MSLLLIAMVLPNACVIVIVILESHLRNFNAQLGKKELENMWINLEIIFTRFVKHQVKFVQCETWEFSFAINFLFFFVPNKDLIRKKILKHLREARLLDFQQTVMKIDNRRFSTENNCVLIALNFRKAAKLKVW